MRQKLKILGFVAAIVALFLFGRSCGINSVIKNTKTDTVIHIDTTHVPTYVPVPVRYDSTIFFTLPGETVYDTLWGEKIVIKPADTMKILKDYYASRFYSDTIKLKKRGRIAITDTVSRNRITGRSLWVEGIDTTITKTMVFKPPKRIVGYFTMSAMGNLEDAFISGGGIGFGVKTPGDRVYQIEYKRIAVELGTHRTKPFAEFRVMLPIRFNIFKPR